ncbi:alpha/beta hydrolase [Thiotrichales bacterium 19S9-12]|nr:alpha/beta hydrolase [Thiotrichales bacterium 19S9-11]MCF6812264.1 alpha/beta hydrolase [Thiotrichales bacterium 19S9-12]
MINPILEKLVRDPSIEFFKSQPAKEQRKLWADRIAQFYSTCHKPDITHKDITIQTESHQLNVRLYKPTQLTDHMILFFHGGGWSLGSINTYQLVCDYLADKTQTQVLSVDYRLAPEHKFPSAINDAVDSFNWLVDHCDKFNINPKNIIVIGDSSGGNLTAVLCHLTKNQNISPKAQVLWYPAVDADYNYPSKQQYTDLVYMLDRNWLEWFYQNYARYDQDRYHPYFSPINFDEFSQLPPTLMVLAEFDPLHDEGLAYAQQLTKANNHVTTITYPGMIHGFIGYLTIIKEALNAIEETNNWLKSLP